MKEKIAILMIVLMILLPLSIAQTPYDASLSFDNGQVYSGDFGKVVPVDDGIVKSSSERLALLQGVDFTADIPARVDVDQIDIAATTQPGARIELTVNGGGFRRVFADENGSALFRGIALNQGNNTIVLTSFSADGNSTAKTYNVFVDMVLPVLQVSSIPEMTGNTQINISGNVNKKVDVEILLKMGETDTNPPAAPTGLQANSSAPNVVTLTWDANEEADFFQYIIYRNDVGVIATASPATYTSYQDILVNPNTRYEYSISAMDTSCLESPRSRTVAAATSPEGEGGKVSQAVEVQCTSELSEQSVGKFTANASFSYTVPLQEGYNTIIVRATDLRGKTAEQTRTIFVDSQPPTIEIREPRPGIMIYERFANSVDINGYTEPYAKVELSHRGEEITETRGDWVEGVGEDEGEELPETSFRIGEIKAETTADKDGYFEFENVNLKSYVRGSLMPEQVDVGDETLAGRNRDLGAFDQVNLYLRATDRAGKQAVVPVSYTIGTCWGGNFSWGITPLLQYQSPSWLSAERLSEGTEEISFYFNFTYNGYGQTQPAEEFGQVEPVEGGREEIRRQRHYNGTRITSVTIRDACDDYIRTKPDYDWACKALSGCRAVVNPDGNMAYVTCHLGKVDEIEDFDGEDLKDWFKAIGNEMRFPLMITLGYQEAYEDTMRRGTQTSCEEVAYAVDNSMINFSRVLPDWLLYDGVRMMDNIIKGIDTVNKQLRQVLKYVTIGCMGSFVTKFVLQVTRRISCSYDNMWRKVEGVLDVTQEQEEGMQACQKCLDNFADVDPGNFSGLFDKVSGLEGLIDFEIQDKIPDACMEICYPRCAKAWDREAANYNLYRWACDRVFCHAAPSRWTEDKNDTALREKAKNVKTCDEDSSMKGQPLTAVKCLDLPEKKRKDFLENVQPDDICFELYDANGNERSIYILGQNVGENVYAIDLQRSGFVTKVEYVVKVSDKYYLTASPRTCADVCGVEGTGQTDTHLVKPQGTMQGTPEGANYACTTVSYCNGLQAQGNVTIGTEAVEVKTAYPEGFTEDCFYGKPGLQSLSVVSKNPDERYECCCLNTGKLEENPLYYHPGDIYMQKAPNKSLFGGGEEPEEPESGTYVNPPSNFSEMKWSYRYWKTRFMDKEYNPDRYIKGRDQSACFGQNNFIFDGFAGAEGGNVLIVDPFKQHTSAFQCGCITGIINRLTMIQNILLLLSGCLKEVRETGKGDAGVCKEIFTQYVCTLIWDIISYLQNGCIPLFGSIDFDKQEAGVGEAVKVGTTSVFDSMDDSMNELSSEYGNAQVTSLLGTGEGSVARAICLAAFGFDWELSVDAIVDAAYSTPFATLVQPITKSREYLSFDPRGGEPKYEYSASWIINPGCNFDYYDVQLVCVSGDEINNRPDINCDKIDCDCSFLTGLGPSMSFYRGRSLEQNNLVDVEHDELIRHKYRFDHLKFTLRPDRRISEYAPQSFENCFPSGHEDGVFYFPLKDRTPRDIIDCNVDFSSGVFICESGGFLWDKEGNAYFSNAKLNDKPIGTEDLSIKAGEELFFDIDVTNKGRPKCLHAELTGSRRETKVVERDIDYEGLQSMEIPLGLVDISNIPLANQNIKVWGCTDKEGRNLTRSKCMSLLDSNLQGSFIEDPTENRDTFFYRFYDSNNDGNITFDGNDTVLIEEEVTGNEERVKLKWDDNLNAAMIGGFAATKVPFHPNLSDITFRVDSGFTGNRNQERWEIKYGLYYVAEEGYGCADMIPEDVVISTNGERMENTKTFYVKEVIEDVESLVLCSQNGSRQNRVPCDCNNDSQLTSADCNGERRYCLELNGKLGCYPECTGDGSLERDVPCKCRIGNFMTDNPSRDCLTQPCKCLNNVISK